MDDSHHRHAMPCTPQTQPKSVDTGANSRGGSPDASGPERVSGAQLRLHPSPATARLGATLSGRNPPSAWTPRPRAPDDMDPETLAPLPAVSVRARVRAAAMRRAVPGRAASPGGGDRRAVPLAPAEGARRALSRGPHASAAGRSLPQRRPRRARACALTPPVCRCSCWPPRGPRWARSTSPARRRAPLRNC